MEYCLALERKEIPKHATTSMNPLVRILLLDKRKELLRKRLVLYLSPCFQLGMLL